VLGDHRSDNSGQRGCRADRTSLRVLDINAAFLTQSADGPFKAVVTREELEAIFDP